MPIAIAIKDTPVHERGEHLGAMVAEGPDPIRRRLRELEGVSREGEREQIAEHVTGIRQQRETVREEPPAILERAARAP